MSSKLTELTKSSASAIPPSVLCGSGILSQLASPSMASLGHLDPSQTYDSYKAVEVLDPSCTECFSKGKDCFQHYNPRSSKCHYCFIGKKPCCHTRLQASNVRRYLWSGKDGPFGKEFPVSEEPTPDGTSGFSNLTGSRQRDVARWTNVGGPIPVGGRPIYSSSEVPSFRINIDGPLSNRFHSHTIPITLRTFQSTLAAIPTYLTAASPSPSHSRPALNLAVRQSPITTSQHL
ncbi:hypothetical protein O181_014115 [Austropuccinia psidii MF-1]|uniref:Uncharacterized protein n=1 Tax=Austropuccinia psidii MF-1 TaxID=1389203 RepID=A0A9Q3GPL5_9BASI|nr:hypothetical protein [Austropuccinia psidii MF-1]